jgi:hypothetical protein
MDPPDVEALQAQFHTLRVEQLRLTLASPPHQHLVDALEAITELRFDRLRGADVDVTDELIAIVGKQVIYWQGVLADRASH